MGCLFWSDFDPKHRQNVYLEDNDEKRDLYRAKMVLFLIQYRKYINYFVEQSLILGMWGQFQHEVIAISSILIARFEMKSIEQVRWKKKKVSDAITTTNIGHMSVYEREGICLYKYVRVCVCVRECV